MTLIHYRLSALVNEAIKFRVVAFEIAYIYIYRMAATALMVFFILSFNSLMYIFIFIMYYTFPSIFHAFRLIDFLYKLTKFYVHSFSTLSNFFIEMFPVFYVNNETILMSSDLEVT